MLAGVLHATAHRGWSATVSCLFLFGVAWPGQGSAEDRALLVGINTYQSGRIPELQGPANDVQAFYGVLTGVLRFQYHQIRTLRDDKATRANIIASIDEWLISGTRPGDRAVFYYSGHGAQARDLNGDEDDGKDEALIPYDAEPPSKGNQNSVEGWILDDEVSEKLRRLQGRKTLAVFDSCHSGTVTRDAADRQGAKTPGWDAGKVAMRGGADLIHQREGSFLEGNSHVIAFFAVAPNQIAFEDTDDPREPHGVFTRAFVDGIAGKADGNRDNRVTYGELLQWLRNRSDAWCRDHPSKCRLGMTPVSELQSVHWATDINTFGEAPPSRIPAAGPNVVGWSTSVFSHENAAGLVLHIHPGARLRLGEKVRYSVRANRPGRLILLDIDAGGTVTQLFPNQYTGGERLDHALIPAHRDVIIPGDDMPFTLRTQEPLGHGKLIAILIEDISVDTGSLVRVSNTKDLVVIDDPADWLTKLRQHLAALFHLPDGHNRAIQWSLVSKDYEVVR